MCFSMLNYETGIKKKNLHDWEWKALSWKQKQKLPILQQHINGVINLVNPWLFIYLSQ